MGKWALSNHSSDLDRVVFVKSSDDFHYLPL